MTALPVWQGMQQLLARMKPAVPMTDPRSHLRHPASLILPVVISDAAPEPGPDSVPVLVSPDYSRLKALARLWRHPDDPVNRALTDKLGRCRVVSPDVVPSGIAVLGARVVFSTEGAPPDSRILVMPEDDAQDGFTLAISTPAGAALLGAVAGQAVEMVGCDGRRVILRLLTVDCRFGLRPPGAMLPDRHASDGVARCDTTLDTTPCTAVRSDPWAEAGRNHGGRS